MNDKISVPLKECVKYIAAMPCHENLSMPEMNFMFAIRSRLTAMTISPQNVCYNRIVVDKETLRQGYCGCANGSDEAGMHFAGGE